MWSDPALWYQWIKVGAFIAGLLVGVAAIASPSWVWLRKQILTPVAGWLATLGAMMLSMSIWQSVQIEGPGFKANLAAIAAIDARLDAAESAAQELEQEVRAVKDAQVREVTQLLNAGISEEDSPRGMILLPRVFGELEDERELLARLSEVPRSARTRLIVANMLDTCWRLLIRGTLHRTGAGSYQASSPSELKLPEGASDEEAWDTLQRCTERLAIRLDPPAAK